jgi:hypothetical protein
MSATVYAAVVYEGEVEDVLKFESETQRCDFERGMAYGADKFAGSLSMWTLYDVNLIKEFGDLPERTKLKVVQRIREAMMSQ